MVLLLKWYACRQELFRSNLKVSAYLVCDVLYVCRYVQSLGKGCAETEMVNIVL